MLNITRRLPTTLRDDCLLRSDDRVLRSDDCLLCSDDRVLRSEPLPTTLRRLPTTLRRLPTTLRRLPTTLRRLRTTLRQLPTMLRPLLTIPLRRITPQPRPTTGAVATAVVTTAEVIAAACSAPAWAVGPAFVESIEGGIVAGGKWRGCRRLRSSWNRAKGYTRPKSALHEGPMTFRCFNILRSLPPWEASARPAGIQNAEAPLESR